MGNHFVSVICGRDFLLYCTTKDIVDRFIGEEYGYGQVHWSGANNFILSSLLH